MKDGLWTIVDGTESAPDTCNAHRYKKYVARRDRALAIIVLSVEPSFDGLAVGNDAVSEEDRAVHLLSSLPDSFGVLVTALEANPEVPKMEAVIKRLLHEERKLREQTDDSDKAMNKAAKGSSH